MRFFHNPGFTLHMYQSSMGEIQNHVAVFRLWDDSRSPMGPVFLWPSHVCGSSIPDRQRIDGGTRWWFGIHRWGVPLPFRSHGSVRARSRVCARTLIVLLSAAHPVWVYICSSPCEVRGPVSGGSGMPRNSSDALITAHSVPAHDHRALHVSQSGSHAHFRVRT